MNIKVILTAPFPLGMALTNRVYNYTRGFVELGNQVEVIIPLPTEEINQTIKNTMTKGIFGGVNFIYTSGMTLKQRSLFKKIFFILKGLFKATSIIIKDNKNIDCLLIVSNKVLYLLYFKLLSKILNCLYITEKSELPFIFTKKNLLNKIYIYFFIKYIYKCFDGILVISNYLYSYFISLIRNDARLLIVPIMVNIDEFTSTISKNNSEGIRIVYAGTLCEGKDGIMTLLEAFKIVTDDHKAAILYIIGDLQNSEDKDKILAFIENNNLEHNVILTGFVPRKELIYHLKNATVLALTKPSGLQARSCFPSKLGEYLATGNPVVTTNIGEISSYLKNGESAFLAEPDNPKDFAIKIESVLSDPDAAKKVGKKGKHIAQDKFNYIKQAERIVNFINELLIKKR